MIASAGQTTVSTCQHCGFESPAGLRFCGSCGAQLPEEVVQRQTRKVVTALFCDVTGSTALGEELDPEILRGVINRYFGVIRSTIERHGGTVEKFVGDAVMAVFGIPVVREDDALRAVRAAAEIRERLPAVAEQVGVELRFRTGVNTGTVLMSEGENFATGDAVNVAARLEQAAAPGEIVIGPETLRLVRDAVVVEALEPLTLKGKSDPVHAHRLISVDPLAAGVARHLEAELVGRERELALLKESWERVVRESGCHLFTLLGSAGVGKSRLVAELLAGVGDEVLVLRGRCLSYGEGITFWPLVEALVPVGEPAAAVLERLTVGGAAVPEELFWDVRRLLEALAAQRPMVLYLDDLQWSEGMLLDLIDHVVDLSRGAPILVLCTARPELLEDRPSWGGGKFNAQTVLLEPLGAAESLTLLDQLGEGLDDAARARVVAASEGNPLFLEEIVALARESGEVTIPSTIQALLAARLERLGGEERELLERGAVEGEVFHRLALRALAGERLAGHLDARLAGLVRRELIRPHAATFQGDEAFRFRHLLIRDAAYDALPKAQRSQLHEAFADWLEDAAADLAELDEIAGWHLEQTVRYRRELGQPADRQTATRAAAHLYRAGRRAGERSDVVAARSLLERSLALSADDAQLRAEVSVELAEQLIDVGDLERIDRLLSAAESVDSVAALAALTRFQWLMRAHPQDAIRTIDAQLPAIIDEFERARDDRGLAKAHLVWANRYWLNSRALPTAEQMLLAAEHARRAGDDGLRSRARGFGVLTLCFSEQNVDEVRRELESVADENLGPYVGGYLDLAHAWLAELDGRFAEAQAFEARAIERSEAMGMIEFAGGAHQALARTQHMAGETHAARASLKRGDQILAGLDERSLRSTTVSMLAEIDAELGDRDSALAAVELSEQLGAAEDAINFVITHGVRASLALAGDDLSTAERWARSAVDWAYRTDFYWARAQARMGLGRVLSARGENDRARTEAQAALDIYSRKGDRSRAAQARSLREQL